MAYPGPVYPDNYTQKTQVQFGGYNHRRSAGDMEWYDDCNMTADEYPLLASRKPYYSVHQYGGKYHGICGGDNLYIAAGTSIYKYGTDEPILEGLTNRDKLMCMMGRQLVVFPDKIIYNEIGGAVTQMEIANEAEDENGVTVWFYSGEYEGKPATANTILINCDLDFRVNDAVQISGNPYDFGPTHVNYMVNNMTIVVRDVKHFTIESGDLAGDYTRLTFYDNSFWFAEGASVLVPFENGTADYEDGYSVLGIQGSPGVVVSRNVPDLDILFEHENRLWGAGKDASGNDTIYASANGLPCVWENYDATGLESWAVNVLSEGDFTGGCSFLGYPIFFKNNHIYKIYGDIPSEFSVVGSADIGVAPGCGRSLAIAGEKLYYLSRIGVMVYTGALPQLVSQAFGDVTYTEGIGGSDGVHYWLSCRYYDEARILHDSMFVYATQTGIWHREHHEQDSSHLGAYIGYAWHNHGMYAMRESTSAGGASTSSLDYIGDPRRAPQGALAYGSNWYIESADFTESSPRRKWVGASLEIRAELEEGASFSVYIKYRNIDESGTETEWEQIGGPYTAPGKRSYIIPSIPRRTDFYKLKIAGTGRIWIYSIAPMTEQGSSWHGTNGG